MRTQPSLETAIGTITLVNETVYILGSADTERPYPREWRSGDPHPTSFHGILVNDAPAILLGAGGGCSTVHPNSMLALGDRLYVAVGDQAVCLSLDPLGVDWALEVDFATCFGLYLAPDGETLISHGELSIARFTRNGQLLWESSGPDIFSGDIQLMPDFVEVENFNGDRFRFAYSDGASINS